MANENDNKIVNLADLKEAFDAITPAKIGALPVSGGTTSGDIIVGPTGTTRQAHSTVTSTAGHLFMYSDGTTIRQGLYSIMNDVHREPVRINSDGSVVLNGSLAASNITGVLGILNGGTNATTPDGARENIGIYSSSISEVHNIVNANPTITTMDALVQYVFDTYFLPKNKVIECCSSLAVTSATDSRCIGANTDLGTIYNDLTGVRPSYGILTFERLPHNYRIVVTYTPLKGGTASESKCPQIYATYGADDNTWTTGKKMENASGWYIKGSTRVKGNAETSYRWGDVNITSANIGLGTATNKLTAKSNYGSASHMLGFEFIVDNSLNNTLNGHKMILLVRNDNIQLYDETTQSAKYSLNPYNTRVKGNAESSYRTGDVNLTPENIGAARYISLTATAAETIYAALSVLDSGEAAVIHMTGDAFRALTGNKSSISYGSVSGIVYRVDSSLCAFDISRNSGGRRWAFQATITSSAITPNTVYTYSGAEVE